MGFIQVRSIMLQDSAGCLNAADTYQLTHGTVYEPFLAEMLTKAEASCNSSRVGSRRRLLTERRDVDWEFGDDMLQQPAWAESNQQTRAWGGGSNGARRRLAKEAKVTTQTLNGNGAKEVAAKDAAAKAKEKKKMYVPSPKELLANLERFEISDSKNFFVQSTGGEQDGVVWIDNNSTYIHLHYVPSHNRRRSAHQQPSG